MLIIPAVDIRGGKCVRLIRGKLEEEIIYSNDPVFMAKLWQTKGAKRLHITDLDGAFSGKLQNFKLIEEIKKGVNVPVEVGGGIRDIETAEMLIKIEIEYIIIGTTVIYNPSLTKQMISKFGKKIIASIDAVEGKVAIGGWKEVTPIDAVELGKKVKEMGIKEVIYTDIQKDGTLEGPNLKGIENMAIAIGGGLIAAGGISTLKDIKAIKNLEPKGIIGVIIGKAIYVETLKLEEAIKIAEC